MVSEGSLPYLKQPATGLYFYSHYRSSLSPLTLSQFTIPTHTIAVHTQQPELLILISVSHRSLGFQSGIFPADFLTQTLQVLVFVFSSKRATHHDNSILLGFTNIISGEQCKSRNCVLQFFIFLLLCPHFGPNAVLGALLSNTVTLCPAL